MTLDVRETLQSRYEVHDAEWFPNALRYVDQTPLHKFVSVVAPIDGTDALVLFTSRDSFDEGLCKALFGFLGKHPSSLRLEQEVTIIEGFKYDAYGFDSVLVLNAECHRMYVRISPELNDRTLVGFPLFRCELTGAETAGDIDKIRHDGLCTIDWNREPTPYVMMRFRNHKTGARSTGKKFWYTNTSHAEHEILELIEDGKSFVELKNFRTEEARIAVTRGEFTIETVSRQHRIKRIDIKRWLKLFLTEGLVTHS